MLHLQDSNRWNPTAYEAGHWLDASAAYRTLLGSSAVFASDGRDFPLEVNKDWTNLNNYTPPCAPSTRGGGIFRGYKSQKGAWICANNGNGPGLASPFSGTNEQVLKRAWSYYFNQNPELFAEEVAYLSGNAWGGNQSPDEFLINQQFSCSQTLVQSLMRYGQIPGRTGSILPWPSGQNCPKF